MMVYVVWWRTAGESSTRTPDGVRNWVGAYTTYDDADVARKNATGDWISTGIIEMPLYGKVDP